MQLAENRTDDFHVPTISSRPEADLGQRLCHIFMYELHLEEMQSYLRITSFHYMIMSKNRKQKLRAEIQRLFQFKPVLEMIGYLTAALRQKFVLVLIRSAFQLTRALPYLKKT